MIRKILFTLFLLLSVQGLKGTTTQAETLDLEDAVKIALSHHQQILQAQELYSASSAEATASYRDRLPRIDFGFSYDRLQDHPYQNIGGTSLITNDKNLVHYQINIKQPLFTGFALSARQELAKLHVDMAHYDLLQAQRSLALNVNVAALRLLQAEAGQRLAEQQRDQLKNHLADVVAAYGQGMVPGNDRLKAEVAVAAAEQQLCTITNQVKLARSRLNLLLGRGQQQPLEIKEPQIISQPTKSLQQLIETALQQRPEILTAQLAVASSEEKIRLARSNDYPHIALVASYWRDGKNLSASDNPYRNDENASIGVHLDWNLFSAGADRQRVVASQHRKRAQLQVLSGLQDQVRIEVEEAFQQRQVAASNQETASKALQQAKENHRLSILQFHENLISTTDLLDARTLLTHAETDLLSAHYGILLAEAQLSFAIGQNPLTDSGQN